MNKNSAFHRWLPAILTGQLAGLIMAVVVIAVFSLFLGKSPFYPVQVIGSILLGESVLHGFDFPAVLTGLVLHQGGPTVLWSLLFGAFALQFEIRDLGRSLALGLAIGLISMTGPYLLIPALFHLMQGVDLWNREVPMAWDWAAHLVFGASFALYPWVRSKLEA
jgi:hypothetical protein